MRNIYIFLLLLLGFTGIISKSYATNFANHSEYFSCDTSKAYSTAFFNVGINASGAGLTVETAFGDGYTTTNSYSTNGTNISFARQYAFPGTYTVRHILKQSGTPIDTIYTTVAVYCHNAVIRMYLDKNSNCSLDLTDSLCAASAKIEIDSAGVKIDTVSLAGFAYKQLTPGYSYTLRLISFSPSINLTCPSTGTVTHTISYTGATYFDFGFNCSSSTGYDLAEYVHVRAGRHSEMVNIVVANNYCNSQNAVLVANLSPKYGTFMNASPTPTSVSGNTITWNLSGISITKFEYLTVYFETGSGWLTPGDTIHTSYYLTPTAGDVNIANNTVISVDTVRSSFDPNDKSVSPSGNIMPGTKLTYTVEFENDGNDTAHNIYILDTLSNNVDVKSFELISATAAVNTSIIKSMGYNILRFDFPNINLLDSSYHGKCTGMVIYSIKAKTTLPEGTYITNRAGIYFDDNEVVMTKTVENIIAPLSVGTNLIDKYTTIYPNPVHDVLTVKSAATLSQVRIINAMGQTMTETTINAKEARIDVKQLPAGVYYLILNGNDGVKTEKIIKE